MSKVDGKRPRKDYEAAAEVDGKRPRKDYEGAAAEDEKRPRDDDEGAAAEDDEDDDEDDEDDDDSLKYESEQRLQDMIVFEIKWLSELRKELGLLFSIQDLPNAAQRLRGIEYNRQELVKLSLKAKRNGKEFNPTPMQTEVSYIDYSEDTREMLIRRYDEVCGFRQTLLDNIADLRDQIKKGEKSELKQLVKRNEKLEKRNEKLEKRIKKLNEALAESKKALAESAMKHSA